MVPWHSKSISKLDLMLNVKNVFNSFWVRHRVELFIHIQVIAKNFPKARTVFQNNLNPNRFYAGIRTIVFGEFQLRLSRVAKTETEINAFLFYKKSSSLKDVKTRRRAFCTLSQTG